MSRSSIRLIVAANEQASNDVTGTLSTTLNAATLSGSGGETFTGTLSAAFLNAVLLGSGAEAFTGQASPSLAHASMAASGSADSSISGILTVALSDAAVGINGIESFIGAFAPNLASMSQSMQAEVVFHAGFAAGVGGILIDCMADEIFEGEMECGLDPATLFTDQQTQTKLPTPPNSVWATKRKRNPRRAYGH